MGRDNETSELDALRGSIDELDGTVGSFANEVESLRETIESHGERAARAIERLGTNNASTSMGALELMVKEIRDGSERLAEAIVRLADAVESLKPR